MARRNSGRPRIGGYWFGPSRSALAAVTRIASGPSSSGNPWPRFTAPCSAASADITVKMVVGKFANMGLNAGVEDISGNLTNPARLFTCPVRRNPDRLISVLTDEYLGTIFWATHASH